jgi:RNA polymerase-binding transcription factor DksA
MSEDKIALLEKKKELEARLEKIRQDIAGGLNPDSEERATQLENRDVLYEIQRVTAEELEAVKKRLNQIG